MGFLTEILSVEKVPLCQCGFACVLLMTVEGKEKLPREYLDILVPLITPVGSMAMDN